MPSWERNIPEHDIIYSKHTNHHREIILPFFIINLVKISNRNKSGKMYIKPSDVSILRPIFIKTDIRNIRR